MINPFDIPWTEYIHSRERSIVINYTTKLQIPSHRYKKILKNIAPLSSFKQYYYKDILL